MNLLELQADPAKFRSALLIDCNGTGVPFGERVEPWQDADFRALDPGWRSVVTGSAEPACRRAWLERPRGHSKSHDVAVMASWCLFASRRPLHLIGCAADQDQARLIRDAVGRLTHANPWLARILDVQRDRVVNAATGSTLELISSDAKTSFGQTPDGVIADELTHWKGSDLWTSMLSSAPKKPSCVVVVITNAGFGTTWQWDLREAVRTDPDWHFSRLDGPAATWIGQRQLDEQRRLLPPVAFRRLWLNEWSSGGGDALTAADIAAAFDPDLRPQPSKLAGFDYVAGLDLGVSRDASAACVLGVRRGHDGHGRVRLAATRTWRPAHGMKVDLQRVEDHLLELHKRFGLRQLAYDPWQATHLASRLAAMPNARLPVQEVTPTGQNLQRVATATLEAFADRRLELYPDAELRRDLERLRVEERSYGFRLTSPRDEHGHGDLGTAFCLALLAAAELASRPRPIVGVRVL